MLIRTGSRFLLAVTTGFVGSLAVSAAEPATKPLPKATPPQAALKSLRVFPPEVTLKGPRDKQQLIVLGEYQDSRQWDLTREATFQSQSTEVVRAEAGG